MLLSSKVGEQRSPDRMCTTDLLCPRPLAPWSRSFATMGFPTDDLIFTTVEPPTKPQNRYLSSQTSSIRQPL
jgi:hypothetical protein